MIKLKDLEAGKAYICKLSDLELLMIEVYKTPAVDKVYDYINVSGRNPKLGQGYTEKYLEEYLSDPILGFFAYKGVADEDVQEMTIEDFRSTWKRIEAHNRKGIELTNEIRRKYKIIEFEIAPFNHPMPF